MCKNVPVIDVADKENYDFLRTVTRELLLFYTKKGKVFKCVTSISKVRCHSYHWAREGETAHVTQQDGDHSIEWI